MAKNSALQIADYLIQRAIDDESGDLLTNLKLQKLLYYAQGCYLAIFGEELFGESIEAWDLGPVVPEVYHQFKVCGRNPIEDTAGDEVEIAEDAAEFLNVIYDKFGVYSASRLVRMTHSETPWKECYVSGMDVEMDKKRLQGFFSDAWIDEAVAVEEDDFAPDFVEKIRGAVTSAEGAEGETADEVLAWLEAV